MTCTADSYSKSKTFGACKVLDHSIDQRSEVSSPLKQKSFILFFGCLASLALDQLTKFWVTATFRADESLAVIPGYFSITLRGNPGAAFGLFRGKPLPFFLSVNIIAIVFILYFVFRADPARQRLIASMSLILGGALGNASDRILREGSVVDFLDLHHRNMIWPTFNFADLSIVAGVILFLLDMSRHDMRANENSGDERKETPQLEDSSGDNNLPEDYRT